MNVLLARVVNYVAAFTTITSLILGFSLYAEHKLYKATSQELSTFKHNVEILGKRAEADRIKKEASDNKRKQVADNENKRLRADLATADVRLREQIASSRFTSQGPGSSSSSEITCFKSAEFNRALQHFVEGTGRLATEGTSSTIDLDTAKKWAQPGLKN